MKSLTVSRQIRAPLDRVEALLTDIEHAADRIDGITRIEMLSEGPFGVGTRWRETRVMFGKEATEEMEITEYVPRSHYTVETDSCGAHCRSVVRFEPTEDGTNVTMEFEARPVSFLAKLTSPLSGLMMKRIVKSIEADLSDLARAAESPESQTK